MAKADWGTKRICMSCGARFYDMRRDPIVCPSCGTAYNPELVARPRRARPVAAAGKGAAALAVDDEVTVAEDAEVDADGLEEDAELEGDEGGEEPEEEEDEAEDGEDAEAMIEDASELGEDDAMADVIETGLEDEDER